MDFGAHLPLMDFGGNPYSLDHLTGVLGDGGAARVQRAVGQRPHGVLGAVARWADGAGGHDRPLRDDDARDHRVAPGDPRPRAAGQDAGRHRSAQRRAARRRRRPRVLRARLRRRRAADFDERWARLDESVGALRALWREDAPPFSGRFYSTEGISLEPRPASDDGPPIWIGSWGSKAGLSRTARLADGWLASAYNTTPDRSARPGRACRHSSRRRARTPRRSPTRSRRCGSTSPTARPRPTGSCASG